MTPRAERRIAYLVSSHPALSQAFVEREITALRALGLKVDTFAVRPTATADVLGDADRAAASTTTYLLATSKLRWLWVIATTLARAPGPWARAAQQAATAGPRSFRSRLWQLFYLAEATLLAHHLRARGITHIHVHFANNAADIARLAATIEPELTWSLSVHGPTELRDVVQGDLAAKVRAAIFVACITDYCRSQIMALVDEDHWPKLHVVRMSVDADRYGPRAAERATRPPGPLRVLSVGRLVGVKGQSILIEAIAALAERHGVTAELRLVGNGPARPRLEEQVRLSGAGDRISLLGGRGQDELPDLYAWADVFCLPSFAEGLPVVLMEAMATELPVVTSRITGIPELVEDGVTGLLVTPGRADEVALALHRVAEDRDLRHALGVAGRAAVIASHLPEPNARLLVGLFQEAAADTVQRGGP